MSKEIVFDIETIGDIKQLSTMKVTVVSVYQYETDSYRSFEESELTELWKLFEKADRLIGYNSEHFDLPVLNNYYAGDLLQFPHLDLLKVIKDSHGKRFKLNDIAKATLQIEKSADGLQAMQWFKEGKMDLIKSYCEQDVKVTKDIYEFGKQNKMVYYPTITGDILPLPVNFDMPKIKQGAGGIGGGQGKGINLTLPF